MHHRTTRTTVLGSIATLALAAPLCAHAQFASLSGAAIMPFAAAPFTAAAQPMHGHNPGYLGVDIADPTDDDVAALKLPAPHGAIVTAVDHDGPAGKVGLHERDVILKVNSIVVESSDHFRRVMHEFAANANLTLLICRDGQQQTIAVRLANRREIERQAWHEPFIPPPDDGEAPPAQATPQPPTANVSAPPPSHSGYFSGNLFAGPLIGPRATYTGAMLESVGQLCEIFGVKPGLGLLVKNIDANSPAAAAGLKAGDVITRVNANDILRPDDWFHAVRDAKGKPLTLDIIRNKQPQTITLTPTEYHRGHGRLVPQPATAPAPAAEPASSTLGMNLFIAPDFNSIDDSIEDSIDNDVFSADDVITNPAAVATTIHEFNAAAAEFFAQNASPSDF